MNVVLKEAKDAHSALGKEASALQKEIKKNEQAMSQSDVANGALSARQEELRTRLSAVQIEMTKAAVVTGESRTAVRALDTAHLELSKELTQTSAKIKQLNTDQEKNTASVKESGTENKKYIAIAKEKIDKFSETSKKIGDLTGSTKKYASTMGEMAEAIAKAAGNEDAAAEIKKKTATAIEMMTFAQNAATIATETATFASMALDTAMLPITITVGAIALAVGGLYLAFEKLTFVHKIVEAIGSAFSWLEDKIKSVLHLHGDVVTKTTEVKAKTEETGKATEQNTQTLNKQTTILHEHNAALDQTIKKKKEINALDEQHNNKQQEHTKGEVLPSATIDPQQIAIAENTNAELRTIDTTIYKAKEDNRKTDDKKAEESAKKQKETAQKYGAEAIKEAQKVSDAIFANAQQKRDNDLKATEDKLNAQKNAELLNTTLTASQRSAIEKKYKAEEANAKLQAWKADQKAKEEQAIINGLLAFTMSLATVPPPGGYVAAAIALASAGVQAGLIASKSPPKFAKGVISLDGPGTATSDSIAAYLSKGESVITAERTQQYKPILEQIHAGTYQPLPIPMLSTLPMLTDVSRYVAATTGGHHGLLDYDKLGRAVAKHIPAPVTNNIQMNEKGFVKYMSKRGNTTEYLNNEIKF